MSSSPQLEIALVLGCGGVCIVVTGVVLIAVALSLAGLGLSHRGSPASRLAALQALGYQRVGERTWSMPFRDTALEFHQIGRGWRWTVRLPHDTLTLHIEERSSGLVPEGAELLTDDPAIDSRFAIGAEPTAEAVALLTSRSVGRAMLAMPWLSLRVHRDELVVDDPELRGISKLTDGTSWPGSHETVGAECDVHEAVVAFLGTLFDSLYSKQTGPPLPEHR